MLADSHTRLLWCTIRKQLYPNLKFILIVKYERALYDSQNLEYKDISSYEDAGAENRLGFILILLNF